MGWWLTCQLTCCLEASLLHCGARSPADSKSPAGARPPIGDGSPVGAGSLACAWVAQTDSLMMDSSSLLMVSFTIASRLGGHEFTWPQGPCLLWGFWPIQGAACCGQAVRQPSTLVAASLLGVHPYALATPQGVPVLTVLCSALAIHCSGALGAAVWPRLAHCSRGSGHGYPVWHAGHCSGHGVLPLGFFFGWVLFSPIPFCSDRYHPVHAPIP